MSNLLACAVVVDQEINVDSGTLTVQSKPEKKPGTSSPVPLSSAINPCTPLPVNKATSSTPLSINIPRFYFPKGLPNVCTNHEEIIARIEEAFTEFEDEKANICEMGKIAKDVVETHPGLTFLKDAPEFHSRYITTTLALLEEEDDINQITDYFSYEHFYVIYCKFWELDTDHDLYISQKDLARYSDQALSNRIIERIFSGAVVRGNEVQKEGRMSYADFVWLLISEEDKRSATSIEYWFRCMDLDGDGVLSMYELEYFYEEQCERMEVMGIEPLPFHDLLCQMLDLVKPEREVSVRLAPERALLLEEEPHQDMVDTQRDFKDAVTLLRATVTKKKVRERSFEEDYDTDEVLSPSETGDKADKLVLSDLSA
ncbi:serine threonine-protein phosphatase 2a regulatory subunit b subunit alpha isoform x2 [Limosa lapponica baueri]|uniref:Serine threonine-protein phosphatase 2a regulatory subunit b subunit alpha isoform x2 n=1 Tax=Limosa lapponica baueri TaxID=1758121 RepID=A0A2I0TH61_LIMLA|nr:serine threonine-protein phosphatase 2a regulatory subunit b subunit alpha isoform x2 [Limosa lapponica baueri]